MRRRVLIGVVVSVLMVVGVIVFWPEGNRSPLERLGQSGSSVAGSSARKPAVATTNHSVISAATAPALLSGAKSTDDSAPTDPLVYRLTNTAKPVGQLLRDDRAILLENALIDTTQPLSFQIPERLRAEGDPGSYLVQSRGAADAAFRSALTAAGAELVSYFPNNAWLVRASAAVANQLAGQALVQTVLPWEPIYKLKSELLVLAMEGKPLANDAKLNLLVFGGANATVTAQLGQMNITVLNEERSPFGTVITVEPPEDWVALARLPGVQLVEQAYRRARANDRTRVRLGVSEDTQTQTNYLGLTGKNVLLNMNDTGVDDMHPDLAGRVFANDPIDLTDTDGHGTFVAGILMGSGLMSPEVVNARGSLNPGTNSQYRGMAPEATLFVQDYRIPDATLQENVARTNAFISNNSWLYSGSSSYSLAAASYDAAVRDSLPGVTGSQPVLYVFPAGNDGEGSDDGTGGRPGRVRSPGTAKNVVTVGALELARDITNIVEKITLSSTNTAVTNSTEYWKGMTSSENHVAGFSSRGNVGVGIEGEFGRFKPDVVAPGTFVISTRSTEWDELAYYNPTNHHFTSIANQSVQTNRLERYNLFLPQNAVGFSITLLPNADSPVPFPNMPIYVRRDDQPTTLVFDLLRTNFVAVPPDLGGPGADVGQNWFYAIGNRTRERVFFDIRTEVITTNDLGNYYTVLSNLNNSISSTNSDPEVTHHYRYESGTSIAAPAVSGTLALMQEFFEQSLLVTNSPALMKALLINGARSAGDAYDFQVQTAINYQGWGLVRLENSLQPGITNAFDNAVSSPANSMLVYDQSPTNALATGQKRSWTIDLDEDGQILPLRVTLAWTDPPGNPAAGVKLVNDLDLIITNNITGEVFLGNDFNNGSRITTIWDTNEPPNFDAVNNVENIYLPAPLDTNYTITVMARRVNVNAVTAHPNDTVQDFALVISSGSGEGPTAIRLTQATGIITNQVAEVVHMTNSISVPGDFSSSILVNQRVGANTPLLGTTNGSLTQWRFYVLTNGTDFTNASFLVSQQTDLAIPRQGVNTSISVEATRRYADLDLYVSTNPALTNLDAAVLAASSQSRSRNELSGDEFVTFTNSTAGATYYIGVKSEDQQAAQFEFWGIFSLLPLGAEDGNGYVRAYPMLGYEIPDGGSENPGGTRFVAYTRASISGGLESVRRVLVTNNISHARFADLINTLEHNSRVVVLDNHREVGTIPVPPGPYGLLYDDSGEGDIFNAVPPDGPGSFESFIGELPGGTWYFTYSDDALTQTGRVNDVRLRLERQREDDGLSTNSVAPNSWIYFSRNVPVEATNLTICVDIISTDPGPLELYVRKDRRPTQTVYDHSLVINPPGACLEVDKSSLPPLTAGRYFIGIFNPNPTTQTFVYSARLGLGVPPTPLPFGSGGSAPLLDDAVTEHTIFMTNDARIATIDVGLRIEHPRVSDLAVTLISPRGTRVLLAENRGGSDPNGFGSSLTMTNFIPVTADGGGLPHTNIIDTAATVGTITIDYDFEPVADRMSVFYEGILLADTGEVSGPGRLVVDYGPGSSTLIEIIMNLARTNTEPTHWSYTVSSISSTHSYLTFTENTNLTTTPIKFAPPPFVGSTGAAVPISDFEPPVVAQNYPGPTVGNPDGWSVLTSNAVTVITNTAQTPPQSLALRSGEIRRTLATTPGRNYRLNFAYRKAPNLDGIISWWPGENNTLDIVSGNIGTLRNGANFASGLIGQAYNFNGSSQIMEVADAPSLNPTNSLTIEAWVNVTSHSASDGLAIFGKDDVFGPRQYMLGLGLVAGNWVFRAHVGVTSGFQLVNGSIPVVPNTWYHAAMTYDGVALRLYVNGVLDATIPVSGAIITSTTPLLIGGGVPGPWYYNGRLDEPTIYGRALTSGEIQDIYAAGAAGKCGMVGPPEVCSLPVGAKIFIPGQVTNSFLGTTNWQPGGLVFTATNTTTDVFLSPVFSNAPSGVLVDSFTLVEAAGPRYVLPEESLKVLEGENAYGLWQLEILDNRTGAANNISLLDWSLQFVFQTSTALPRGLTPGVIDTRTIPPGQTFYYLVDVPPWARFATNSLLAATGPLNVYFNQNILPTGTNAAPPDYTFFTGATTGTRTMTTNLPAAAPPNGTPLLLPGQRYYLALENTTASPVTFWFVVDFDLAAFPDFISLTNGIPYCSFNAGPGVSLDYYRYTVSSNAVRAQFEINNPSGDMALLLRRDLPPTFGVLDYFSANSFTNDEVITVFDFSQPVPLSPGDWYLAAANISGGPVSYCVKATEWPVYGTNIVITNVVAGTNGFCLTWTSLPGVHYFVEGLTNLSSTSWVTVSPTITATDYSTTYCVPLPSEFHFFRVREGIALNPYYPPPYIFEIRRVFQGILLTWTGPTNLQYEVQWSPTLVPTVWTAFTNPPAVSSTSGVFQFLDDGSETGGFTGTRFYRLLQLP